jgi:transcription elongation factor GreB
MSRAFVKDDAEAPPLHRPRAPLPEGVRNYVTRRGLALLRTELDELLAELVRRERGGTPVSELGSLRGRIAELESRLASAVPVDSAEGPPDVVRFGACVTIRNAGGAERTYRVVGVDEANAREGLIAFVAPLARALLGKRTGESFTWKAPRGEEELEVIAVDFSEDGP